MLDYCLALWQSIPDNHFRPSSLLLVLQACSEETGTGVPDGKEAVDEVLCAMCCCADSAPLIKLIPVVGDHFTIGYRENAASAAEAIRRHIQQGTPDKGGAVSGSSGATMVTSSELSSPKGGAKATEVPHLSQHLSGFFLPYFGNGSTVSLSFTYYPLLY
jgi:hypothetical protein